MIQQISSQEIWVSQELNGVDLFSAEENATFWLWAYPSLLGWHRKFEWLFSPVTGKSKYPGDIWGIDDAGNLLLVEMKLRLRKRSDPFEDFIDYERNKGWEKAATYGQLLKRWKTLCESEQYFWQSYKTDLADRKLAEITAKGIVPYSSKRFATKQWSTLYTDVIIPHLFEGQEYRENVFQFLSTPNRLARGTIFYFGIIFVKDPLLANLSTKGNKHFIELKTLTGDERANLLYLAAQESPKERCVNLQCGRPATTTVDTILL